MLQSHRKTDRRKLPGRAIWATMVLLTLFPPGKPSQHAFGEAASLEGRRALKGVVSARQPSEGRARAAILAEEASLPAGEHSEEPPLAEGRSDESMAASANDEQGGGQEESASDRIIRHDMLLQRDDLQKYMQSDAFKKRKTSLGRLRRKGILFVAGGRDMISNMFISIRVLRDVLHFKLPIEIVFNGEEELDKKSKEFLEKRFKAVSCIDAQTVAYPEHHRSSNLKGFALKAFALAFVTTFRQVLLLDADNMPLVDPGPLFSDPSFKAAGNLFWPDYWYNAWIDTGMYSMFGFAVPWEGNSQHHTTESGQLLLDRVLNADVLEWLWYLNSHANYVHSRTGGDKDTFKLAFYLADRAQDFRQGLALARYSIDGPFHGATLVEHQPRDVIRGVSNSEFRYHHIAMLQHSPSGRPAFLHRISFNAKFFPDCAANHDPEYCLPEYVSIPLGNDRAAKSLQPHTFAWFEQHVDTQVHQQSCGRPSNKASPVHLDEMCGFDPQGVSLPIPMYPLATYGAIFDPHGATGAAFSMFTQLKHEIDQARTPLAGLPQLQKAR